MKKLYILALAALAMNLNAQKLSGANEVSTFNGTTSGSVLKAPTVISSQTANGQNGYGTAMLSGYGDGIFMADDFEIAQKSKITKVTGYGFSTTQPYTTLSSKTTSLTVDFYEDNGVGAPATLWGEPYKTVTVNKGAAGYAITNDGAASGQLYQLIVDFVAAGKNVELDANKRYWVSIYPTVDNGATDIRFAWFKSTEDKYDGQASLIDPGDLFGSGYIEWTPLADILTNGWDNGLAFTIEGENALGVSDVASNFKALIHNDDSAGVLNIVTSKNNKLVSTEVYDAAGKQVAKSSASKINTSSFAKGVYFVMITTQNGVEKAKFIKN